MSADAFSLASAPLLLPADDETAQIVRRIAHLRTLPEGPLDWKKVEFEVALTSRTLKRYVWVLAALLRARDLTWQAISEHPWVNGALTEAYLRNKHGGHKLPTGQRFEEFIEWYGNELRERFTELLAEQARYDSMTLREVVVDILEDCRTTQRKLRAGHHGQQLLDFNDEVPLSDKELEREALRVRVRKDNTAAIEALFKLLRLTTASPTEITATPQEAREAAADDEPLADKERRIAAKLDELRQLSGEAA